MTNVFTPKFLLGYVFTLFLLPTFSSAQWVTRANGIKPRSELTSVAYNGKIYVFFGFRKSDLSEVEPSAEVYDPAKNTWTLLDSVPANKAATHAAVAVIDNTVWHIGGRVGKNPAPLTDESWIYNITSNTWTQGPKLTDPATGKPLLLAAGGAALLGRTLHVFGGFIINACNHDQSKYHLTLDVDEWLADTSKPAKWKNVSAPLPIKRNHFSTVVLGGKIYALGGQFGHDCGGGQDQEYADVYDPVANTWTALPSLPTPRSHTEGSSFAIDGKIYLVGGQATNPNSDVVTIFDPAANNGAGAWSDDNSLTLPKIFETLSAKVIDKKLIISHGGQPRYYTPKTATYSRSIKRTPVYKFGFYPACATLSVVAGEKASLKTLLFTIDDTRDYNITSNAAWLSITKNATGTALQTGMDVELTINAAGLAPGSYSAKVTVAGTGKGTNYTSADYCVNLTVVPAGTLEAEDAVLSNVDVETNHAGYTGRGFADYVDSSDDYIEWTINKSGANSTMLQFRYANGSKINRPLKLEVNGDVVNASLSFPPTGDWSNWSDVSVLANLKDGINKIRLSAIGYSGANIDHLVWSEANEDKQIVHAAPRDVLQTNTVKKFQLLVSPNPATGVAKLKWQTSSDAPLSITIADALGGVRKTFFVRNNINGELSFSVQDLPAGLYLIFVKQEKAQGSAKLFVSH